jgi:hypothetical protein
MKVRELMIMMERMLVMMSTRKTTSKSGSLQQTVLVAGLLGSLQA